MLGEEAACRYLKKKGWRMIAKNVRMGRDELDILAVSPDEQTLAIIEVRSTANEKRKPELTITKKKRTAMLRVAKKLLGLAKKHDCELRVDIVSVVLKAKNHHIVHFENAIPIGRPRKSL